MLFWDIYDVSSMMIAPGEDEKSLSVPHLCLRELHPVNTHKLAHFLN